MTNNNPLDEALNMTDSCLQEATVEDLIAADTALKETGITTAVEKAKAYLDSDEGNLAEHVDIIRIALDALATSTPLKYRTHAWKIERFDAMQKDEKEGRIAIVPVEPTEEMVRAAKLTLPHSGECIYSEEFKAAIRAAGPSRYFKQEGEKE